MADKKKEGNNLVVKIVIFLALLFLLFYGLRSLGMVNKIDYKGHGVGRYSSSGFENFFRSLNIWVEDYDFLMYGEPTCVDDECMDVLIPLYTYCMETEGCFDEDSCAVCDDAFEEALEEADCIVECNEETYIWDGTPVTDVSGFYSRGFPNFYERVSTACTGGIFMGNWVEDAHRGGCFDFEFGAFIRCDSPSISSAGEVCETIGGTWVCQPTAPIAQISCNI